MTADELKKPDGSKALTFLSIAGIVLGAINIGKYLLDIVRNGYSRQLDIVRMFVQVDPDAMDLVWLNFSTIFYGIILVIIGTYIKKHTRLNFIRSAAILYLPLQSFFGSFEFRTNPLGFATGIYFIILLGMLLIPKVKSKFA